MTFKIRIRILTLNKYDINIKVADANLQQFERIYVSVLKLTCSVQKCDIFQSFESFSFSHTCWLLLSKTKSHVNFEIIKKALLQKIEVWTPFLALLQINWRNMQLENRESNKNKQTISQFCNF